MSGLTANGRERVAEIAARHGVGVATAERLATALAPSSGTQVQFDEPELGGLGQWSRGGMVMVGDMFDNALKARVDALCTDLSALVAAGDVLAPEADREQGWPPDLGRVGASGAQNDMRYAVFPETRRLAVARGSQVTVYDTGEHRIGGVSQAQSGGQTLTFTSKLGSVRLADLPVIEGEAPAAKRSATTAASPIASEQAASRSARGDSGDVLATIERLAELRSRGILTDEEFARKKAELLDRL
jgi:hypothetical protein